MSNEFIMLTNFIPAGCPNCGSGYPNWFAEDEEQELFMDGTAYQCHECLMWFQYAGTDDLLSIAPDTKRNYR